MSGGDPLVGRVLDGRYEILRKLARGGMAGVYLASDRRLTRTVAVKVMHESLGDDPEFVTRFDREARAAARLSHPNVVSVFDQGVDNGRPYIVMEYVEGCTLRHLVTREAPFDPERALELLIPVMSAVAAAHEAGIIHRDLKPENVLISERGQIKVADFGLARTVNAQTQATQAGMLIGTVSYLAPELVTHQKADTRCDVYALGVILFEMLTGRKPHTGDTPIQVAYAHVHNEVPAPSSQMTPSWRDSRNGIPPYLDALVVTATTRDPRHRQVDARVLLHQASAARAALTSGVMDDPLLSARMRQTVIDPSHQVTEMVPLPRQSPGEVHRTATLRFTPSTPSSPGHPSVADGMPYCDSPATAAVTASPTAPEVQQRQRRRRRRGAGALVLTLVLALVLGVGGWWVFQGRFVDTPAFAAQTKAEVQKTAEAAGVLVSFDEDFSETVPTGQVIRSSPPGGAPVLRGGDVLVVLSKGPERIPVPGLLGRTVAEATSDLSEARLLIGKQTEVYHDTAAIGTIVKSTPAKGKKVKPESPVAVEVSKGPQPISISSVVGSSFEDARQHFTDAGLKVEVTEEKFSAKVAKGDVISQTPEKGTLFKGETISFVVSKGPEMVEVPNVTWKGVDEARQILKDLGFKVKVEYREPNLFNLAASTTPRRGTSAPKGSTVTIFAG